MDPTQNQSGTPGPIFSAGPAPEEPPMAPAPTGSGPKNPFSRGSDIVLQPSNDYYSGGKTRSKKPIIIVGIVAVVAVIALLVMLPLFSRSPEANSEQKTKLYQSVSAIHSEYSYVISSYNDVIGLNPTSGNLVQHPESILFYYPESYDITFNISAFLLDSLQESKDIAEKLGKYESDIDFIIGSTQANLEAIKKNSEIMTKLNEAFISPIHSVENWQYIGCVSSPETQELLNSSDKKLASIAQKYNQLACKDDIQVVFGGGELQMPESVDESTMELLRDIANSLANYFGTINVDSKDEALTKLEYIMNETKPKEQNESEKNE